MKKLILAAALFLPMVSAHAGLMAKAGDQPLMYSQDSTAGNMTSDDIEGLKQMNIENAPRDARRYCVEQVWKEAAEANTRLDLGEDATDLPGVESSQHDDDVAFQSHKNVELIISYCTEARIKKIINQNK